MFFKFFPSGNNTESTTVKNFSVGSTVDTGPSTMDTLLSVTAPSQNDEGNTSHLTQTTAPLSPDTIHTITPVQSSTTATKTPSEPIITVGASSLALAKINSTVTTATISQQEHTTESLAGPRMLSPETSATTKNTSPTDNVTTSVSTTIPTKTTSLSSLPLRPETSPDQTSPDQTSPSTASPAPRTATVSASSYSQLVSGTKIAVVEVAGGSLTSQLVDTASLLAIVLFGLIFFLVTVAVFVMQAYESYNRKDYTQVDYLINGMYNDSGV